MSFRKAVAEDASKADRKPSMTGRWDGGGKAIITLGDKQMEIGGNDDFNAMQTVLAALIACDIDVIALHTSFLGIKIEQLSIEATGFFNVQSYIGAADTPGPGYREISYTVLLNAPGITDEQKKFLIERCKKSSPVGDTLSRAVPIKLEFLTA